MDISEVNLLSPINPVVFIVMKEAGELIYLKYNTLIFSIK